MTENVAQVAPVEAPELTGEHCKVLFVDDEANILKSLRRLTMDEAYETLTAHSGQEALDLLAEEQGVSLIVSDQRMPQMSGAEFLARAKDLYPDVPRVILTGYADVQAAIDAINQGGACRYLKKPWEDKDLLQIIDSELQKYILLQENRRLQGIVKEQNEMLQGWNSRLKSRVMEQTVQIRKKNEALNAQNTRLKKTFRATISALTGLIELRDPSLRCHARNVAELVQAMGETLKLDEETLEQIIQGALLHDIGKIGIPDELLARWPDNLADGELQEFLRHAIRGQTAIDAIEDLRDVGLLIRHHHEHFDGSGYPDSLARDDIPLGSRMIGLADFADRRLGKSPTQTQLRSFFSDLKKEAGKRFDPHLAHLLKEPVEKLYAHRESDGKPAMVVDAKNLCAGMILAEDLYSGTGLLLLNKGSMVERDKVESLQRYGRLDPFPGGIVVLKPEKGAASSSDKENDC